MTFQPWQPGQPPHWTPSPPTSPDHHLMQFMHSLQHQVTQGFDMMHRQLWQLGSEMARANASLVEGRGHFQRVGERQDRADERIETHEEMLTVLWTERADRARNREAKAEMPRWERRLKRWATYLVPPIALALTGSVDKAQALWQWLK